MIKINKVELILLLLIAFTGGIFLTMSIYLATQLSKIGKRLKDLAERMGRKNA